VSELDDERAAEALEALGGWTCQNCGEEMRDPAFCDACSWLFCPYCGTSSFEECHHLVTIADPDVGVNPSPFEGLQLPCLPERPDGFWPDEWSDVELRLAFGDLRPLLDAYDFYDPSSEPSEYALWREIRWMLSEIPASRNRFVPSHPGHSHYEDAFFGDPDKARAEIAEIIERLRAGLERLASTYEQGRDKAEA
jgi:hypothetical protein